MFENENDLFEISDNEEIFKDICDKLKHHPFKSPWSMCSEEPIQMNSSLHVREITISGLNNSNVSNFQDEQKCSFVSSSFLAELDMKDYHHEMDMDEVKFAELKNSLLNLQENSTIENIKGIELLHTLSLPQVPKLCTMLSSLSLNDISATLFLRAILAFEMPLSLSLSSALIKCIVYPQVFENPSKFNGSRNLLAAVLNFSEVYPKASIDEVVIPCIRRQSLEPVQLETLTKMAKTNLANEYIPYCIRITLEQALAADHIFTLMLNLIERKVHLENQLHDKLAWKADAWSKEHYTNVKFTKLIISILTVYGNELEDKQLFTYQNIVKNNKTIMKKAAENALKKLCNT